jgi:hypothetical protein
MTGDSRAGDSSANDQHVETFAGHALKARLTPRARQLWKGEFFAHRI